MGRVKLNHGVETNTHARAFHDISIKLHKCLMNFNDIYVGIFEFVVILFMMK